MGEGEGEGEGEGWDGGWDTTRMEIANRVWRPAAQIAVTYAGAVSHLAEAFVGSAVGGALEDAGVGARLAVGDDVEAVWRGAC